MIGLFLKLLTGLSLLASTGTLAVNAVKRDDRPMVPGVPGGATTSNLVALGAIILAGGVLMFVLKRRRK